MAEKTWLELIEESGDEFNPAPEGDYLAKIVSTESKVSKNSGNTMIVANLEVAEGPEAGKSLNEVYISKPGPGTAPEKLKGSFRMFMGHLRAVGIDTDTLKTHNPTMAQIAGAIKGKLVQVTIEHESWRGNPPKAKVQGRLMAPPDGAIKVEQFPKVSEAADLGYSQDAPSGPTPVDSDF